MSSSHYELINKLEKEIRDKAGKDYKVIGYYHWENTLKDLAGKTLTIIDASIQDLTQRKAMKDLIKQNFWKAIYECQRDYYDGSAGHSVNLEESKN